MIEFQCLQCGKSVRVADQHAGRRGKCPSCGQGITIPSPQAAPDEVVPLQATDLVEGPTPGRPARRWLIPVAAGVAILMAAVALAAWWWAGHRPAEDADTGSAAQNVVGAPAGRVSPSGLAILADGQYDPARCALTYTEIQGINAESDILLVASADDLSRMVLEEGRFPSKVSLWVPPAAPVVLKTNIWRNFDESVPVMSPDGMHYAFIFKASDAAGVQSSVIMDGREVGQYPYVSYMEFSPDSKRLAVVSQPDAHHFSRGGSERMAEDIAMARAIGNTDWRLPDVNGPRGYFPPASKPLGTMASSQANGPVEIVEVEGAGSTIDRGFSMPVWSPDGKHKAWVRRTASDQGDDVCLDGTAGKIYFRINPSTITFSPDSKHLAYIAPKGEKRVVVCDQKEGKEYNKIDASSLYVGVDGLPHYVVTERELDASSPKTWRDRPVMPADPQVRVDGQAQTMIEGYFMARYTSPDGRKQAMIYQVQSDKFRIDIDDRAPQTVTGRITHPIFSPSGEHFAYINDEQQYGGKCTLVVDGLRLALSMGTGLRIVFVNENTLRCLWRPNLNWDGWQLVDVKVTRKD